MCRRWIAQLPGTIFDADDVEFAETRAAVSKLVLYEQNRFVVTALALVTSIEVEAMRHSRTQAHQHRQLAFGVRASQQLQRSDSYRDHWFVPTEIGLMAMQDRPQAARYFLKISCAAAHRRRSASADVAAASPAFAALRAAHVAPLDFGCPISSQHTNSLLPILPACSALGVDPRTASLAAIQRVNGGRHAPEIAPFGP